MYDNFAFWVSIATAIVVVLIIFSARTKISKPMKTRTKRAECADEVLAIAVAQ